MRVDMYLLRDGAGEPDVLACRLVGKAWPANQSIQVACIDVEQCRAMDELLWHLPSGRFIAHSMDSNDQAQRAPVLITTRPAPVSDHSILVDLRGGEAVADHCRRFARILDIVGNSDAARTAARHRYKAYRQLTTELHTHELS